MALIGILKKTVSEADAVLAGLRSEKLILSRRIQGYDVNVIGAIMHTIPHFRGHIQEIIHMTREQAGEKYRFDFVPKGKEQEAAG